MIEVFEEPIDVSEFHDLRNFVSLPVVDSTNRIARGWIDYADAEEVTVGPLAIHALEQTAGRGRRERVWASPPGGLYLSFVWKVAAATTLSHIPLAAAVWGAEACSRAFGMNVGLKWPNDLLSGGRKIGGILTEAKTRGEDTHAVVGFGINVRENSVTQSEPGATSVERILKHRPSVGRAFQELCRRFDSYLAHPDSSGVAEEWRKRTVHRAGDAMRVSLDAAGPGKAIEGTFEGITEEGFLRLKTKSGERVVAAGEVQSW